MAHFTKYIRKMRETFILTVTVSGLVCFVGIPFFSKKILNNEVAYYSISINGTKVGAANSAEEVNVALAGARLELSRQYDSYIYMDPSVEITKENRAVSRRMDTDELKNAIYSELFDCVLDVDTQLAYTVRVGDFTVSLASKEEITELFTRLIDAYNPTKEFQVAIHSNETAEGIYSLAIEKQDNGTTDNQLVASIIDGTAVMSEDGTISVPEELTAIGFEEDIVINAVYAQKVKLSTVDQAYNDITKESSEKTYYTVVPGDTLSGIAVNNGLTLEELFELNEGYNENTIIMPGDLLVITVPVSEITIVTTKKMAYEEDYNAEPNYVDDNTQYRGTNTVLEEGTTGHRSVVAEVTFTNGVETERTYLQENIMVESKAATIAVGTLTPPTYIKPIYGGTFTSGFGYRWGTTHWGVDWGCPVGTSVMASCDGVVTRAGWYSDYGYCVDIRHSNGTMTRYAHNSAILVNVGQQVEQGQQIARSGSTGYVTGPHVHFEIWVNGTRVNPLNYVNKY